MGIMAGMFSIACFMWLVEGMHPDHSRPFWDFVKGFVAWSLTVALVGGIGLLMVLSR